MKQSALFDFQNSSDFPEGFSFRANVITPEHEAALIEQIRTLEFRIFQFRGYEGNRRVISFGWHYDFNKHNLVKAEPIPLFLRNVYDHIQAASDLALWVPDHALVTEYAPGAGIGWHKDRPAFNHVLGLSLGSDCVLRLRKPEGGKWQRVSVPLAPRSAYAFEGPARWQWEHSIPTVQQLRYSVTFRNLRRITKSPA